MMKSSLIVELATGLEPIGFVKVDKILFRAARGERTIEHFIELNLFGSPVNNVACDYGLRSLLALEFALSSLKLYGGEVYNRLGWKLPVFNVRCQVGRSCNWSPRSSLRISDYGIKALVEKAVTDIGAVITPGAGGVVSLESYCDTLIADGGLFPWITCNAAMRAAEYIFVSRQLGKPEQAVASALQRYTEIDIKSGLDRGVDPNEFIRQTIEYSRNTVPDRQN
jgi:hypothetical protein